MKIELTPRSIVILAALDEDNGIGRDGSIPWDCPADRARFKARTMGCPLLMGRKTFHSLGDRPLSGRPAAVWTHHPESFEKTGDFFAASELGELLRWCRTFEKPTFVIGGEDVYREAVHWADGLILSRIEGRYRCDRFFPTIRAFERLSSEQCRGFCEEIWKRTH